MTATMRHSGEKESQAELDRLRDRLLKLSATDDDVREEVVAQNEPVNFDPDHVASILEVRAGSGRIGSAQSSYAALLQVDEEPIADIIDEYLQEGIDG